MNTDQKISVNVIEKEPVRGAALRLEDAPTPEKTGLLWGRLLQLCAEVPSNGPAFDICHENVYEACWALPNGLSLPEGLIETEAPGGCGDDCGCSETAGSQHKTGRRNV